MITSAIGASSDLVIHRSGVRVFGGFAGTETKIGQRNVTANVTTLSGDIGKSGNNSDNCYNVIRMTSVDSTTRLDGFTISHGNANSNLGGPEYHSIGGGIYNYSYTSSSNPTIANCMFVSDSGGGIFNSSGGKNCNPTIRNCIFRSIYGYGTNGSAAIGNRGNSSPSILNCNFINNTGYYVIANYAGINSTSSPNISNCSFSSNNTTLGVIYSDAEGKGSVSSPIITNSSFYNDTAYSEIYNYVYLGTMYPTIINCTFGSNINASVANLYNSGICSVKIENSILWDLQGNGVEIYNASGALTALINTDIKGGWTGLGWNNLNVNPGFVNVGNGNLQLNYYSPCINAGNDSAISSIDTLDIVGNKRIQNNIVDMGAYESSTSKVTRFYAAMSGKGSKNGTSWANAFDSLTFRNFLHNVPFGDTIFVSSGTYKPSNNRDSTFAIPSGARIFGGFAGTETKVNQRNLLANTTILSGDIGLLNNYSDNTYNVLRFNHADNSTVLDGFTISYGNANSLIIYGAPAFRSNGGGIYNDGSNGGYSNPVISNCIFKYDSVSSGGGGSNL